MTVRVTSAETPRPNTLNSKFSVLEADESVEVADKPAAGTFKVVVGGSRGFRV